MDVVDHDSRRIRSGGGCVRSLDLEGPQVSFWVLATAIHQRQTGQEQHLLLMLHGTECRDVHSNCIDAKQSAFASCSEKGSNLHKHFLAPGCRTEAPPALHVTGEEIVGLEKLELDAPVSGNWY